MITGAPVYWEIPARMPSVTLTIWRNQKSTSSISSFSILAAEPRAMAFSHSDSFLGAYLSDASYAFYYFAGIFNITYNYLNFYNLYSTVKLQFIVFF